VNISEAAVAAAITMSVVGVSYAALQNGAMTGRAQAVADAATCRALDQAVLAYASDHETAPVRIADVRPYVRGDVSRYRLVGGRAVGPGCPPA
jgi:hypothetical protein